MYKLKEPTLYLKSGENRTTYFLFTQYGAASIVLRKAFGVPRFETFIITPCKSAHGMIMQNATTR